MTKQAAGAIAAMNDQLRGRLGMPIFGEPYTPGRIFFTAGINALPPSTQIALWFAIRDFTDFTLENNPHGERDFGAVHLEGAGEVFWNYYADETMTYGSEDPSDPARCFRVLTIMLASEY
jgi:hypothetical protein